MSFITLLPPHLPLYLSEILLNCLAPIQYHCLSTIFTLSSLILLLLSLCITSSLYFLPCWCYFIFSYLHFFLLFFFLLFFFLLFSIHLLFSLLFFWSAFPSFPALFYFNLLSPPSQIRSSYFRLERHVRYCCAMETTERTHGRSVLAGQVRKCKKEMIRRDERRERKKRKD